MIDRRSILRWTGSVFRHVAEEPPRDPLDFSYASRSPDNRWNASGEPTLYTAGSAEVAIAEWARSFRHLSTQEAAATSSRRTVFRLTLRLSGVIDLRDDSVMLQLGVPPDRLWYADRDLARAVAGRIRRNNHAQAIIVPSLAFPDDASRWNLVVFLEKVPDDTATWVTSVDLVGPLHWR